MIEHTPGASPNLSTQILLALDELQEMANRAYWIAGLVPPGTKPPAAIVLSQGQIVIRSADAPFTSHDVERIRELIDWVRSYTELGSEIEEIRRKLAP